MPEGKTEIEDPGEEHEVNPDPAVPEVTAPPAEESTSSNEPAPGSSNGSGAVYDPVSVSYTHLDVYKRQAEHK